MNFLPYLRRSAGDVQDLLKENMSVVGTGDDTLVFRNGRISWQGTSLSDTSCHVISHVDSAEIPVVGVTHCRVVVAERGNTLTEIQPDKPPVGSILLTFTILQ